jgi:hypothetical protein
MDMPQNTLQGAKVTDNMVNALRATRPWTMLLAILGFISIALMLVGGVLLMFTSMLMPGKAGFASTLTGILYLVIALVYFIPALYLLRYSSAIERFMSSGLEADLESALSSQKSFWKFVGMLSLIGIVLTIVGIVAAIMIPLLFSGKTF